MTRPVGRRRRGRVAVWVGAGLFMVLPVLMMRGIDRQSWDLPGEVVFLTILLAGVGIAYELAARVPDRYAYGAAAALAMAAAGLTAWINLAVGIIGSEDDPANLIYAGVLAVAFTGAVIARLRPPGMARAMVATAAAQAAAFVVAVVAGLGFTGPITLFFMALWLASASLFRAAARASEPGSGATSMRR